MNLSRLYPTLDEDALIKELVAQFLAHDGYVETAREFAEEVQSEDRALKGGSVTSFDNFPVEEDLDAVNIQRISSRYLHIPQGADSWQKYGQQFWMEISTRH